MSLTELCFLLENKQEDLHKELYQSPLDYSIQLGDEALRTKLAQRYQTKTENFIVTSGASEAILLCFLSIFKKGDEIIVQKPIYQSLFQIAEDLGVKIHNWDSQLENLEQLIKNHPQIKALVINNPNNPTGLGFEASELSSISEIIGPRLLICDEVFQAISSLPSCFEQHENSIIIADLSKCHSMPGLRIGWILCRDKDLIAKFSSQKNYLSLRNATNSEIIAKYTLDVEEKIIARNKKTISTNLDFLFSYNKKSLFFDLEIDRLKIQGLSIFPKLKQYPQRQDVLFVDGKHFGLEFENYMRIGFGMKNFSRVLECSLNGINNDPNE